MKSMYLYTLEEAIQFAQEKGIRFDAAMQKSRIEKDQKKLQAFNIKGYCEVVPAFLFTKYGAPFGEQSWDYNGRVPAIKILEANEYFRFIEVGPFKYYFTELFPTLHKRCDYCPIEAQKPNLIGAPTKTKIQAWANYVKIVNKTKQEYAEKALQANIEFVNKFKAKYPDGWYNTLGDGWTSEFKIYLGPYYIHYQAHDSGVFGRQFKFIYNNLPSDEELLAPCEQNL